MLLRRCFIVTVIVALSCRGNDAQIMRRGAVQVFCHRTAHRDVPENTLESLALAARMGCDVIEVDVRRTLDGQLVLNHDGYLDRFTETTGDIETTTLAELDRMDFGAWHSERFRGLRLAHFDDALRLARKMNVNLHLDIKTKGLGPQILEALASEGMTQRVEFGGEWDDVRGLLPTSTEPPAVYVQPGTTRARIAEFHREGKSVVGNFSLNGHESDLPAMREAVAAGVDVLWVEYPRLGAEAAGRPVEATLQRLTIQGNTGPIPERVVAIRELAQYIGFPLQAHFLRWLDDSDDAVSHEAALALVESRPVVSVAVLLPFLSATNVSTRRNAAWAVGNLAGVGDVSPCVALVAPLLVDVEVSVVKQALISLVSCPVTPADAVPAGKLLPLLSSPVPVVRGLAAVVLAKFQPSIASRAVPEQLAKEETQAALDYKEFVRRGSPKLTPAEIDPIIELYRAQMKMMHAISILPAKPALETLNREAFRSVTDYSNPTALYAGYQLWDRLGDDPGAAIHALSSRDSTVADRAEWALVEAGPGVLPAVRSALPDSVGASRERLIRVLAWQADGGALMSLHELKAASAEEADLVRWAIAKIESMEVR